MSCSFLGEACTSTTPCCDGFKCNSNGVCDFYTFDSSTSCPGGYSKVYTSQNGGLCAVDLQTEGSTFLWILFFIVIVVVLAVCSLIGWKTYKYVKHHKHA